MWEAEEHVALNPARGLQREGKRSLVQRTLAGWLGLGTLTTFPQAIDDFLGVVIFAADECSFAFQRRSRRQAGSWAPGGDAVMRLLQHALMVTAQPRACAPTPRPTSSTGEWLSPAPMPVRPQESSPPRPLVTNDAPNACTAELE